MEPGEYLEIAGGKITHSCEEDYKMFSGGSILISAGKSVIWRGGEGVRFGDYTPPKGGYGAKDDLLLKATAKIRLGAGAYNGEFCFDWIDVNADTGEIEKIQDVPFSDVEYFYKAPAKPKDKYDLGDMVEKAKDEAGARAVLKEKYPGLIERYGKFTDVPCVLMKKGQEIELSLEVSISEGTPGSDEMTITGDDYYEFEFVGGQKDGKTAKKKIAKDKEKIGLKIKCLKDGPRQAYKVFQDDGSSCAIMGGIVMMENVAIKIQFRVIALVSKDNNSESKARALFTKFSNAGILKHLQENSINQAGYEVELENQAMFDNLPGGSVTDYFYAFDPVEWKNKNYFDDVGGLLHDEYQKDTGKTDAAGNRIFVTVHNQLDYVTRKAYLEVLKITGKGYSGGTIILADYPCSTVSKGAYSRTSPLNHEMLIVFSKNTADKGTYAHEIGHLLGLTHTFFDAKEKDAYESAKSYLLGGGETQKGLRKRLSDLKSDDHIYYKFNSLIAIKNHILDKLKVHNRSRRTLQEEQRLDKKDAEARYINYKDSDLITFVGKPQMTKKQHLAACSKNIDDSITAIQQNEEIIEDLNSLTVNNYVTIKSQATFLKEDALILLEENLTYTLALIDQIESNYVRFKINSTRNAMDYSAAKVRFLSSQVATMRADHVNYIDSNHPFTK